MPISKSLAKDLVLEGHVTDITEWAIRDVGNLYTWLEETLKLDKLTLDEIKDKYRSYLPDNCDD